MPARHRAVAVLTAGALGLLGCTSSAKNAAQDVSSVPLTPLTSEPTTVATTSASHSPTTAKSTPRPTTHPPTTAPATTSAPPAPPAGGCTSAQLEVTSVYIGAVSFHQERHLVFTNTGSSTCSLLGFPGVTLYKSGQKIGSDAVRSSLRHPAVTLKPGGRASARLYGPTTCDAPVSDTIRVIAPNETVFMDITGGIGAKLRACPLTIDPVVPA